jgi:hypothetical protein
MSKFKNNKVKQSIKGLIVTAIYTLVFHGVIMAQSSQSNTIIFENVNIFDGRTSRLIYNQNVLVQGNRILAISSTAFENKAAAMVIKGDGKNLDAWFN